MASDETEEAQRGRAAGNRRRSSAQVAMQDVATLAKVSLMSVSLVVNGRAGRVSQETRTRIEEAIASLNYRPNTAARSLRLSRGTSIGMIVLDASPQFMAAPFTTHLVAGLSNRLSEHGYPLTLQGVPPSRIGQALAIRHSGVDGLCLLMGGSPEDRRRVLKQVDALGVPLVLFQEAPQDFADCCRVCQDDIGGGRLLARHLIALGARHFAMLVPGQSWFSMAQRREGVRAEMDRQAGAHLAEINCGDESAPVTRAALSAYIETAGLPDAIIAGNDRMATAALLELRTRGVAIPGQVMVTGFNGFPPRDVVEPLLTTIQSPAYEMGETGADALLYRLKQGAFEKNEILMPVAFLAGDSTRAA